MIVLDTNVISELARPRPNDNVCRWIYGQGPDALYLCVVVVMEQAFGARKFESRTGSDRYVRALDILVTVEFRGRILGHDQHTALLAGRLRALRQNIGRPISVQDAMIAAICLSSGAALATRNTKDFEGLDLVLINPFEDL